MESDSEYSRSLPVRLMLGACVVVTAATAWLVLWPMWQVERQVRALLEAAKLGDSAGETAAIEALRTMHGGEPAVASLVLSLRERDGHSRRAAAVALVSLHQQTNAAVSTLIELLTDQDELVRRDAASALGELGKLGDEAVPAVPALVELVGNVQSRSRLMSVQAAEAALEKINAGRPAVPHIRRALADPTTANRLELIRLLKRLKQPADIVVPPLVAMFDDADKNVQLMAIYMLADYGFAARVAVPALEAIANDEDRDAAVRNAASRMIQQIKPPETNSTASP